MAGNRSAILAIRIIADAAGASKGFDQAQSRMQRFESGARKAGIAATAVLGGLAAMGKQAFDSASALQQASGAVDSVFAGQSGAVKQLAKDAADSVGLAQSQYSDLAAVLGSQLKNLGIAQDQLVPKTSQLIGLGSDLAATFGGTTAEAVQALSALFRGEADPIERYGVSIKQSDINARLAAQGQDKLTGAAKVQAETQARLALLMDQTSAAQGQFARESDTAAGAQQRMAANVENAKAAMGDILLPVVAQLADKLKGVAEWARENAGAVQLLAGIVGGLAIAVLAINGALAVYNAVAVVATAVQWAMNSAFLANPLTWVVIAIIAVIAAIWLLWTKCEWFRDAVTGAIDWIVDAWHWISDAAGEVGDWIVEKWDAVTGWVSRAWSGAFDACKRAVDWVLTPVRWLINAVKTLIGWLGRIKWPSPPGWVSSLLGGASDAAEFMGVPNQLTAPWESFAAAGPELTAARTDPLGALARLAAPTAAGTTTVINVRVDGSGIVDPHAVADAVTSALRTTAVARGTSPAALVGRR